jgi:hypothetical protein
MQLGDCHALRRVRLSESLSGSESLSLSLGRPGPWRTGPAGPPRPLPAPGPRPGGGLNGVSADSELRPRASAELLRRLGVSRLSLAASTRTCHCQAGSEAQARSSRPRAGPSGRPPPGRVSPSLSDGAVIVALRHQTRLRPSLSLPLPGRGWTPSQPGRLEGPARLRA